MSFADGSPRRIALWIYLHNNGEEFNEFPSRKTNVSISGWKGASARSTYKIVAKVEAENTKPRAVWSYVSVLADRPFVMKPLTACGWRAKNYDGTGVQWLRFNSGQLNTIHNDGILVRSYPGAKKDSGEMFSSIKHYVVIYAKYELIPEQR